MATAPQLALPWASEILSHFRKFLRLFRGGDFDDREEISNASAIQKGERSMIDTVHHYLPYPFTLSPEQVKEKKGICPRKATVFGRGTYAMWAGATPPLVHAARPSVAWSRSSPHVREQGTFLESEM